MSSYFFISYERDSQDVAEDLRRAIDTSEFDFLGWMDTYIPPSDDWKQAIDKEIRKSLGVIVLVTVNSLLSPYVTYEWAYAMGLGRPVIPVILKHPDLKNDDHPAMHPKLADLQWADDLSRSTTYDWTKTLEALSNIFLLEDIPDAVRAAKNALNSHRADERADAIKTLQEYDHPSATEALADAMQSHIFNTRLDAGRALAQKSRYTDTRALTVLREGLKFDQITPKEIAKFNDPEAVDVLMSHFRQVTSERIHEEVADALVKIDHESAVPALREILRISSSSRRLVKVVKKLGEFGDPQAIPEISNYLALIDPQDQQKRITTIDALRQIAHPDALDALAGQLYMIDHYEPTLSPLIKALRETIEAIGGQEAIEIFQHARDLKGLVVLGDSFDKAIIRIQDRMSSS